MTKSNFSFITDTLTLIEKKNWKKENILCHVDIDYYLLYELYILNDNVGADKNIKKLIKINW